MFLSSYTNPNIVAARFSVRLIDVSVGSCVVSLPDCARFHRLAMEGTHSTVNDCNMCVTLVSNVTWSPITLKARVFHGSFEECDQLPLEDAPQVVAGVSTQCDITKTAAAPIYKFASLVVANDYPEAKLRLLNLLAKYRNAIALPGESLRVTNTTKHCIVLKADAQPSYVSSYRLPYSQRTVVEGLMKDFLE